MLFRQSIHTDFDMSGNSAMLPSLKHLDAFFQNCKIRLQIRLLFFFFFLVILIHLWFTLIK